MTEDSTNNLQEHLLAVEQQDEGIERQESNAHVMADETHLTHRSRRCWIMEPRVQEELFAIVKISWPVAFATLCRLAIYTTDYGFVGHLGHNNTETEQILTEVTLAASWGDFVSVIIWSPAYALNSLCSQAIGAKNNVMAGMWMQLALVTCAILCFLCMGLYFVTDYPVSAISKDPEKATIAARSLEYNEYASLLLLPTVSYMAIRQFFQAIEIVLPAVIVSLLTIGFNFMMNYFFVFGFGDNGGLGLIGSPLATLTSMIFQFTVFYLYCIVYKQYHKPYWGGWTLQAFSGERIRKFMKVVIPMTIGSCVENWGFQIITFSSGRLDDKADTAAMSVMYSIWGILWAFYWGWGLALQVRVGKHLGEGRPEAAKMVATISLFLVAVVVLVVAILCFTFRYEIPRIFTSAEDVVERVAGALHIMVLDYVMGCSTLCATNVLEGMSRNTVMSIVLSGGAWGVTLPLSLFFAFYSPWFASNPMHGFWWGSVCGETVKSCILWFIIWKTDWKEMSIQARQRNEQDAAIVPEEDDQDDECNNTMGSPSTPRRADLTAQSPSIGRRSPRIA